jgi:hypothetical protein
LFVFYLYLRKAYGKVAAKMEPESIHFIGEPIEVRFFSAPVLEKKPTCPDAFTWNGETFEVSERLAEWSEFARNMRPTHATSAERRGSWGVGRFYFRVRVEGNRVFELYYDRQPKGADQRKGGWFLYRELADGNPAR